ncbi:MAG: MFS transporter [Euryarchaeota archaeon]|nr:MFS transporter [Euryarchaeota archaeon]
MPTTAPGAPSTIGAILNRTVIVSALGYFVDIYDLLLFSIVRVPSLQTLGVPATGMLSAGVFLLNMQMAGLLVGGILWGILGDKRGRISVLFGSIFLYSVATIANAYVTDVTTYGLLRFVAGVGLAGELGAAVTLVSEVMSTETRGYGTAIVAGVGILGAVFAVMVANAFQWQTAYLVGGGLGLVLLFARFRLRESGMYKALKPQTSGRGDIRLLFSSRERLVKYVSCILIGLPIWYSVGILVTFSPELAAAIGVVGPVSAGTAVMYNYAGAALGGFGLGVLSQKWKSRWWVVFWSQPLTMALVLLFIFSRGLSAEAFYAVCFLLGLGVGYWAVFVTVASEQFGTNLRSTVTTTVPNFIRGSVVPITLAFQTLALSVGLVRSALIVGLACILISLAALRNLKETYGKDLDYLES